MLSDLIDLTLQTMINELLKSESEFLYIHNFNNSLIDSMKISMMRIVS